MSIIRVEADTGRLLIDPTPPEVSQEPHQEEERAEIHVDERCGDGQQAKDDGPHRDPPQRAPSGGSADGTIAQLRARGPVEPEGHEARADGHVQTAPHHLDAPGGYRLRTDRGLSAGSPGDGRL